MADFGANEWLVDEMRERYQADPKSVDKEWAAYFTSQASSNGSSASTVSPTCLSHRVTVPSVTLSPRAGRVTEVDMRC